MKMALIAVTSAFLISIVMVEAVFHSTVPNLQHYRNNFTEEPFQKNEGICNMLTKHPFFEPEMVVGKPWRIYYTWNMKLEDKCLDMSFTNATPKIVNRIYNDMYEYLESQPNWDAATLLVSMGHSRHEMLLFADPGSAGHFVGVPNVVRDGNISPHKKAVPLFKFYMKLLFEGKYLVMADCNIGVSTLSVRRDHVRYRAEIQEVAQHLGLGEGAAACTRDSVTPDDPDEK